MGLGQTMLLNGTQTHNVYMLEYLFLDRGPKYTRTDVFRISRGYR